MTRRAAIVGRSVFDVFPDNPDDPAARGTQGLRATLERVRRERARATMPVYQHDIRRPDAEGGGFERRFWQTSVWPVPADPTAGPLRYLLCRTEDVTARMASERARDDAHIRLEATLAAAEMGTWIWEVDTNRVFADRNLARMFNVSACRRRGRPRRKHYLRALHPDDLSPTVREVIGNARCDERARATPWNTGLPYPGWRLPLGRPRAAGRNATPPASSGKRFPGVVLDITGRKQAEQTLRENEERLRMAVDSARLGTFDLRSRRPDVLMWSDTCRALFGVPPGVPISYETTFRQALHPDDRDRAMAAVKNVRRCARAAMVVTNIEYRVLTPAGRRTLGRRRADGRFLIRPGTSTPFHRHRARHHRAQTRRAGRRTPQRATPEARRHRRSAQRRARRAQRPGHFDRGGASTHRRTPVGHAGRRRRPAA